MKLSEAYPLTHAAYPDLARWDEDFDWRTGSLALCNLLVRTQQRLIEESDEQMLAFSANA